MKDKEKTEKSEVALREEVVLKFWQENKIFEKSLEKESPKGEFIFYEGPPTANGRPGIHHLEARAFKDLIPRFKTMQGYHVRRKAGWDTHGLPVELEVEKKLGLKSKKEIEKYGIAEFNKKCKESVWEYMEEWQRFTDRTGYWVDLKDAYVTYEPSYIESLWNIVAKVNDQNLLYKDYKVVPWCPRCGTALSSHELAQGYQDVKDLSVTVKFKVKGQENTYLLAWTTTPWTLPGNVGLAVGEKIEYSEIKIQNTGQIYILASNRLSVLGDEKYTVQKKYNGDDLIGYEYEPLYPFLEKLLPENQKENFKNAYKVYEADFVTTEDGTGIVHTAVMYGQDDFELGTKVGLPKHHLVDETGHFVKGTDFLEGRFVKDLETDIELIKDLAGRKEGSLLFDKEKYEHSYPFCWRCKTALIYYARDSWYIKMSQLKERLIEENKGIHWEPEYIKEGRFGEWLSGVRDWAISRERYWGTPLPVWRSEDGEEQLVIGSISDLKKYSLKSGNTYYVMRHGEAEFNIRGILNGKQNKENKLTEKGFKEAEASAEKIKDYDIDLIFTSPLQRTKETATIVSKKINIKESDIIEDKRLLELQFGPYEGKSIQEYHSFYKMGVKQFDSAPDRAETLSELWSRVGNFLYEIESKYKNKKILIITHGDPAMLMENISYGSSRKFTSDHLGSEKYIKTAEVRKIDFVPLPHDEKFELDLHRPYIDEVVLENNGKKLYRVKEVMDVWFDSGGMPFAQDHYPFENKEWVDQNGFPADFICEAIDQTRGWFYTLHAVGVLMGRGKAFKNVICLGHILDKEGKKMSKSVGNVLNPWDMINKYGTDVLRFWMYSVNGAGDSKNFDEKTVQEVSNKVFNLLLNTARFYEMYPSENLGMMEIESKNILDKWIISLLNNLIKDVTTGLDAYDAFSGSRPIRDFIAEFSQWYIRRSRDRFKNENDEDKNSAIATTHKVLMTLSKLLAPFAPFFAEEIYQKLRSEGDPLSVHLTSWPKNMDLSSDDKELILKMKITRDIVTLALEQRAKAGIKVRQPLGELQVKNLDLKENGELLELIKDEVNVKKIIFDENLESEVFLNTSITAELKDEGVARDIIRLIQDKRKEINLVPEDSITVSVSGKKYIVDALSKFKDEIKSVTNAREVTFGVGELREETTEFEVIIEKI